MDAFDDEVSRWRQGNRNSLPNCLKVAVLVVVICLAAMTARG
jgi:hypothetical protein